MTDSDAAGLVRRRELIDELKAAGADLSVEI
jgi:hypothetical protein